MPGWLIKKILRSFPRWREADDRAIDALLKARTRIDRPGPDREYWESFWPRLRPMLLSSDRAAARLHPPPLLRALRPVAAAAGVLLLIALGILLFRQPFGVDPPLDPDQPWASARLPGNGEVSFVILRAGDPSEPDREEHRPAGDTLAGTEKWKEGDYFIVPARPDRERQRSRHVLNAAGAGAGRLAAW